MHFWHRWFPITTLAKWILEFLGILRYFFLGILRYFFLEIPRNKRCELKKKIIHIYIYIYYKLRQGLRWKRAFNKVHPAKFANQEFITITIGTTYSKKTEEFPKWRNFLNMRHCLNWRRLT